MAGHRMWSDWFEPANDVRFITHQGHLVRAADGGQVSAPAERVVRVGCPWDVEE